MSDLNGQNGIFGDYYIQTMREKLKEMQEEIKTKYKVKIDNLYYSLKSLEEIINNYIFWLKVIQNNPDNNNINDQKEYNEKIRRSIKIFFDNLINISYGNNFKIIDSKSKLDALFKEIISFDFSPDENDGVNIQFCSYSNSINDYSQLDNQNLNESRKKFIDNIINNEEENGGRKETNKNDSIEESMSDICFSCKKNKPFCSYLNKLYCKECIEKIISKMYDEGKNPNVDDIIYFNDKKELFMNSFETLIKIILLKCNFILNEKSKISINTENHTKKLIERKFKYPIINSNEYKDSDIKFMNDINLVLLNEFETNFQEFSEKNFDLIKLNDNIVESLKNIFFLDDKIYNDDKINNIKNNMMVEEEDNFENNNFLNNSDEFNLENITNENFDKNKLNQKKKILDDHYLLVNFISNKKESSKGNINFENEITKAFNDIMNKNGILFSYNRSYFLDGIIKTEKFNNLSLKEIKYKYQYFDELYEFKNIIDELLIRQLKIDKKLIDYKGHFIIPNKSNNCIRGKEKYYPPYGWIGIGLNVLGKYDNNNDWINDSSKESKWSIAYHGVGGNLPSYEVLKKLRKKIIRGLENGESQYKCHYSDIRHKNKKIGTGVYLTPNINICENYCGQISFNRANYKIALMVKVLNDKIREPEDINFWILPKKYIRIYRILIKKITE